MSAHPGCARRAFDRWRAGAVADWERFAPCEQTRDTSAPTLAACVKEAARQARSLESSYLGSEHLILALLELNKPCLARLLQDGRISRSLLIDNIRQLFGPADSRTLWIGTTVVTSVVLAVVAVGLALWASC